MGHRERRGPLRAELDQLRRQVRDLYEDLELTSVRAWKETEEGRLAIGYMPIYVPREIICAAEMLPVGILGGGDKLEIIRGDAYFQSYICHIPRSTVELALTGRLDALDGMLYHNLGSADVISLDALDGMLFPSICDVIRNLSGMWKMLFPDRYVRYVDVPQNFDPQVGGSFWRRELENLVGDLARLSGSTISNDALLHAIAVYNENRRAIRDLYQARSKRPWVYPTSEVYLLLRAGTVLPPDEHTGLIRQYLEWAPLEEDRRERDMSRVVLVGMFCEQPPLALIRTLEKAGCWIVDDDLLLGLRWFGDEIPDTGDALDNLVRAYLEEGARTASVYQPEGRRGGWLVESVEQNLAEGVIFCAPSFCDPALLEQPMLVAALEEKGIPHTQFKYSENTGQFQVIREQAGTFSDSIRLWSQA